MVISIELTNFAKINHEIINTFIINIIKWQKKEKTKSMK